MPNSPLQMLVLMLAGWVNEQHRARLPPRSPNLNAHAERFVLSIKSECLDRMALMGSGTFGGKSRATWVTIISSAPPGHR